MARRGTVKLSIQSSYDDRGSKQAERALERFQRKFDLAEGSQAMALARSSVEWDQWASDIEAKTGRVSTAFKNVGGAMSRTGDALTTGVTLPMAAAAGVAVKAAIDWETAFAGVEKTVDGTAEQMADLEQGIRDMAKELPASREQIAGVAEAAGQLGIETESVLDFTRVMVDLGEATNMSSTDAATALARFANITQMSQDDFARLGSTIVDLGNNMATTESEIVDMGLRIAGAGEQIGMSEADIMGLAAALSSVGIEAEAGGSAISKTMINIASDVENGGEGLEKWASTARMSADEFVDAWESDPSAALNSVVTGLADMESQGSSTLGMLEDLGITEVRQRDALLRLAGAGSLVADAISLSNEAWDENAALAEEAAKRYATTASQLSIAKNRVTDAAVSLGEGLAPALIDVVDAAGPLIEWVTEQAEAFADLDKEQQQQIIQWAAIVAAAGPVLSVTGRIVSSVGGLVDVYGKTAGAIGRYIAKHQALEAAQLASAGATDAAAAATGRFGAAMGALKWAGWIGAITLATKAWNDLAPAAEEYYDAVQRGEEDAPTAAEVANAPISGLAYAWSAGQREAEKYRETGEKVWEWTDALESPIASLSYGIGLLTTSTEDNADASDGAADAARRYAESVREQAEATYAAIDAQMDAENADIALERSKNRLEDAQARYNEVVAEYGPDSREAEDAMLDLREATVDLEAAERRAGESLVALNTALQNVPRPSDASKQSWVDYYKAIGDEAGYAAAKANAANDAISSDGRGRSASGRRQVTVYGSGGYVDRPELAIVGDRPEYIINPKAPNALDLTNSLLRDLGVSSNSVTIAPGAVQISVSGSSASPTSIAAEVERALQRVVRSSQLMGA